MTRTPEAREKVEARTDRKRAKLRQLKRELAKIDRKERQRRKALHPPPKKVGQAPRVQEPKYLQWIRRLPCVACLRVFESPLEPSEAAHVRAGYAEDGWRPTGMMEKPDDRRTVPLCRWHHRDGPEAQHRMNERSWWTTRGIHPPALCAALSAAHDANEDGAAVIRKFAEASRG